MIGIVLGYSSLGYCRVFWLKREQYFPELNPDDYLEKV